MAASVPDYSRADSRFPKASRTKMIISRVPLAMMALTFTSIAVRYMIAPVQAAATAGITFTSADGITVARVGFAAFPLAFALLALFCLLSERRILFGLVITLTVLSVVIATRAIGIALDHSGMANARLFIPEGVMTGLSIVAMRIELQRRREASRKELYPSWSNFS
jgi:hypothetical protein